MTRKTKPPENLQIEDRQDSTSSAEIVNVRLNPMASPEIHRILQVDQIIESSPLGRHTAVIYKKSPGQTTTQVLDPVYPWDVVEEDPSSCTIDYRSNLEVTDQGEDEEEYVHPSLENSKSKLL